MGDTFEKVAPGEPLQIAARTWNGLLDAGRDFAARKLGTEGAPAKLAALNPAVRVLVSNGTGAAIPAGSVLKLGTPTISAVDYPRQVTQTPLFPGTAPSASTDQFAITLDPLEVDEIGRAVVLGLVCCDVVMNSASDGYASPAASITATMNSSASGPARIIWVESGTGTKKAALLLNGQAAGADSPWKNVVRFASTANIALSTLHNGCSIDSGTAATGDRVLLKNQTTASENGFYDVPASGTATRCTDADTGAKMYGACAFVSEGTVNHDTFWTCTTDHTTATPIVIGTTALQFFQTPSAGLLISGYVNTVGQSFLGKKTFAGHATNSNPPSIVLDATSTQAIHTVRADGSSPAQVVSSAFATNAQHSITNGSGHGWTIGSGGTGADPFVNVVSDAGLHSSFSYTTLDIYGYGYGIPVWYFASVSGENLYCGNVTGLTVAANTNYGFAVYDGVGNVWNGATGALMDGSTVKAGIITAFGSSGYSPVTLTDAAAPNNTLYYSSTGAKLSYKDPFGGVNYLY